jgi:folate-dependent phosphoribosylglycinamide formyltransferase PurN
MDVSNGPAYEKKCRIAFFLSDDYVWNFCTYLKTAARLKTKHQLVGTWIFPDILCGRKGIQIPLWYLSTFGLSNFLVISLFALNRLLKVKLSKVNSWGEASEQLGIPHFYVDDPNDDRPYQWVRDNNIDVILILISNILKKRIISAPTLGIINKHAAVLPSCRGLFPYFWGKLNNLPLGVSFHLVEERIDTGKILIQQRYDNCNKAMSMLKFYSNIFSQYPLMAEKAIENLINRKFTQVDPSVPSCYFGLPKREDYLKFKTKGYCVAKLSDIVEK